MAAVLIKVGALALKTVSKPIAARFERYVMNHPTFRKHTISLAQSLHRLEVWISRGAEGKTNKVFVADLTEEKSVELASKLTSEAFVFALGVAIVLSEWDRGRRKELVKKAEEKAAAAAMRERLASENQEQYDQIRSLARRMERLERMLHSALEEQRAKERRGMFHGIFGTRAKGVLDGKQQAAAAASSGSSTGSSNHDAKHGSPEGSGHAKQAVHPQQRTSAASQHHGANQEAKVEEPLHRQHSNR